MRALVNRDVGDDRRETRKLAYRMGIDALQLWRTCLKYGIFQHALLAVYPVFAMHLAACTFSSVSPNTLLLPVGARRGIRLRCS